MKDSVYQTVYEIVRQIPKGKVSTYGRIARMIEGCTARMVGYAMAATPSNKEIPWHRVINSQGKISIRANGDTDHVQKQLLISEGIQFSKSDKVDLSLYLWP